MRVRRGWVRVVVAACCALATAVVTAAVVASPAASAGSHRAPDLARAVAPPPTPPRNARCGRNLGIETLPLGGPPVVAEREIPFCIHGTVVTRFHGSRAAGCAARGLCGYRGSVTWRPGGGELLAVEYGTHPRRTWKTLTVLGNARPLVTVARIAGGHVVATCRDRGDGQGAFSRQTPVRDGRATIRLPSGGTNQWGERCAGPVHATLPSLPAARLPLAHMLHGGIAGTKIVSRQRFAGGGWAGTISEHLELSAGPAQRGADGGGPSPPRARPRERVVTVTYRASFETATIDVDWSRPRAGCSPLDACGLRGAEHLRPARGQAGMLELNAYGPADRPERDFLTALGVEHGGDSRGIATNGLDVAGAPLRTTAATEQDGARCRATGGGSLGLYATGARGSLTFHAVSLRDTDLLRTSCPGPVLASRQLASARPARGAFASRQVTLAFPRTPRVLDDDGGFQVRVRPRLRIALTRTKISNRVLTHAAAKGRPNAG